MDETDENDSKRLEASAGWAMLGAAAVSGLGLLLSSLHLVVCALVLFFTANVIQGVCGFCECRRDSDEGASYKIKLTPELVADSLKGEGIELSSADRRFQELVSSQSVAAGRRR